ncbi:hypothetical protein [Robertkochia flava]|uniref:hypothetical protein n=1 Tax=Robertkochia flava TaxID=3447986 RepID=UPI001CC9C5B1|nr:hypothetical protein [Robertkochia marina]
MKNFVLRCLCLTLLLTSCKEPPTSPDQHPDKTATTQNAAAPFTLPIIKGHRTEDFLSKEIVQFDLDLNFGGKDRMDARVWLKTNSSGIRIEKNTGTTLIFDGKKAYMQPGEAEDPRARFDIFTWPYFFALPYKLNDPGTQWQDLGSRNLKDSLKLPAAKLSFDPGTGDAPDDWYVVYYEPATGHIAAAGYIVTYGGKNPEEAEANAHAIQYHDYQEVSGIPIATRWTFHNWSLETGLGEQIGEAFLEAIQFSDPSPPVFVPEENSKTIDM